MSLYSAYWFHPKVWRQSEPLDQNSIGNLSPILSILTKIQKFNEFHFNNWNYHISGYDKTILDEIGCVYRWDCVCMYVSGWIAFQKKILKNIICCIKPNQGKYCIINFLINVNEHTRIISSSIFRASFIGRKQMVPHVSSTCFSLQKKFEKNISRKFYKQNYSIKSFVQTFLGTR